LSSLCPFAEYGFNGGILAGCFALTKFSMVSSILSSNVNKVRIGFIENQFENKQFSI
jgi:hypothetical protein